MARKSNNISILQFDTHVISLLRVQRSAKGIEVVSFDQEKGDWPRENDSLKTALTDFIQRHPVKDDMLCTVVPRHEITTRMLLLPTHSPQEAANMVRLSAEEFVPFSEEELVIDQAMLQKMPNGESRVLAVLAHRDVVGAHVGLLREIGLTPEKILLSTACLASAVLAAQTPPSDRYALVDLGSEGLEVIVVDQGRLVYSRGVATDQDWRLAGGEIDAAVQELAIEVRGSLAAFRRESEDGEGVDSVFLSSPLTPMQEACELLEQETGKACGPADFARSVVSQGGDSLSVLPLAMLGAALAAQQRAAVTINLLPETMVRAREFEGLKRQLMHVGLMLAALLIASGLWYYQAVGQRKAMISELDARIAEIGPQARGVAAKQQQLYLLRRQVQRTGSVYELLTKVTEAAPETNLTITKFSYHRSYGIDVWGRARTIDDVHSFAERLRGMARGSMLSFARARSLYEEPVTERDVPVYSYQITIPFSEDEDVPESITRVQ